MCHDQAHELIRAPEFGLVFREGGLLAFGTQPAAGAFLADGRGEGLVEIGVAAGEHALVAQLVEDGFRQVRLRLEDEGIEDRVFEPAQRAVRHHAADINVVAFLLQPSGIAARAGLHKEAPILQAADNGIPPRLRLQRKLRRGFDVPHHVRAVHIHIPLVMPIHGELQVGGGESAQAQDKLQLGFQPLGCLRVSQQLLDLLLVGDDLVLAFDGLAVIAERLAAGKQQHRAKKGGSGQPFAQASRRFGARFHQIIKICPFPLSCGKRFGKSPFEKTLNLRDYMGVKPKRIRLFIKPYCGWCHKAVRWLDEHRCGL